jgi:hypothetical protein
MSWFRNDTRKEHSQMGTAEVEALRASRAERSATATRVDSEASAMARRDAVRRDEARRDEARRMAVNQERQAQAQHAEAVREAAQTHDMRETMARAHLHDDPIPPRHVVRHVEARDEPRAAMHEAALREAALHEAALHEDKARAEDATIVSEPHASEPQGPDTVPPSEAETPQAAAARDVERPDTAAARDVERSHTPSMHDDERHLAPLFRPEVAKDLRARWDATQIGFVDDPQRAVKQADELVGEVLKTLTQNFHDERAQLETQINQNASTEHLRMALRRYRSFFQRVLAL